jgi:methionyl-tRNA formyltransferase
MIQEILTNATLSDVTLCGVVNLSSVAAIGKANYDSYTDLVSQFGFPIRYCENINDTATIQWISDKCPDLIIQSGWSQKFGNQLLTIPKYGCIGEHPAPLPRGRGAACVNWAILTGETDWGDSFFRMIEQYDEGEIYAQIFFEITDNDDVETIYAKVAIGAQNVIRENIYNWSNGIFNTIIKQDSSKATHYKKRKPADGLFGFDCRARELYNHIRAQTKPYPGAFFIHNDKKVTVWKACLSDVKSEEPCGRFIGITSRGGVLVCIKNDDVIELLRVQPEGFPEIWGADWYTLMVHGKP